METRGNECLGSHFIQLITSDLLAHKVIVGLVTIQTLDDVITIAPCLRLGIVSLITIGFGITHQIQPVSSPFLSITIGSQQVIDHFLVSTGRRICFKGLHIGHRGRQARQIVVGTPDPGFAGCWWIRVQRGR